MVTFRVWKLVIVGLVVALFAGNVGADEKKTPAKKSTDPATMERKAKAALALAAAATKEVTASAISAPMPREKSEKACPCPDCNCKPGTCPACPAKIESKAVPQPMPTAQPVYKLLGYDRNGNAVYQVCQDGTCSTCPQPRR